MAELVGLVASIGQLVTLAAEITKLSYGYFQDVHRASRAQKTYLSEISAFIDVLLRLEDAFKDTETLSIGKSRPGSISHNVLLECQKTLGIQKTLLEKHVNSFIWPFKERDLVRAIEDLSRFRSVLADYATANISLVTSATHRVANDLKQDYESTQLVSWLLPPETDSRPPQRHVPGTGKWFIQSKTVQSWLEGNFQMLWCHGLPGVGKTLLAAIMIEELQKASVIDKTAVLYYFCHFESRKQQSELAILRSVVCQLLQQGEHGVMEAVQKLRASHRSEPDPNDLSSILATVCRRRTVYLIIDALDELDNQKEIIQRLKKFVDVGGKVMLTSRLHPDISRAFSKDTKIEVHADPNDIRTFIEHRFADSDFAEQIGKTHPIIELAAMKAGNIFLLAKLVMDSILEASTISKMRSLLKEAPRNLDEAFEMSVARMETRPKDHQETAFRLINWILYAERPLKCDEVIHAFAAHSGATQLDDEDFIPIPSMLRSCVGLVVLDEDSQTLSMVHATASEFFERRGRAAISLSDIAKTSLAYLCLDSFKSGPCQSSRKMKSRCAEFPFLDYASKYWAKYVAEAGIERDLYTSVSVLLEHGSLRSSAFQALHYRNDIADSELSAKLFESLPTGQSALHLAAFWGLELKAQELIRTEIVSSTDSQGWTPLHWACSGGHTEIVRTLLAAGAEIECRDSSGWTPLFWTAFRGNLMTLQLLLEKGADHLTQDAHGWTALHWAVSAGKETIVQALLNYHNTNVTSLRNIVLPTSIAMGDATPLSIAAQAQNASIFELLAQDQSRANNYLMNPTWQNGRFDPPMSNVWRILDKAESIFGVEYYISRFTDDRMRRSNLKDGDVGRNNFWKTRMLHSAIKDQQLIVVKLLITSGADVNLRMSKTALHAAAHRRDAAYTRLLLEHGADISIKDLHGQTALHSAVLNGFEEVVQALIEAGADVNEVWERKPSQITRTTLGPYRQPTKVTPVMMCCGLRVDDEESMKSQTNLASVLINQGANCLVRDDNDMNALHHASRSTNVMLIEKIISEVKDLDLPDKNGMTALHHAADVGHVASVRALVQAGADATVVDMDGLPVCYYAIRSNCAAIIDELIESVDSIDATDKDGLTMLHRAARHCNPKMVRSLLRKGADVKARDRFGRNVLHQLSACNLNPYSSAGYDIPIADLQDVFDLLSPGPCSPLWHEINDGKAFEMNIRSGHLHTPMSLAIEAGNYEVFEMMRISGGVLPADTSKLLLNSIQAVKPTAFRCLIDNGAELDTEEVFSHILRSTPPEDMKMSDLDILLEQLKTLSGDINKADRYGKSVLSRVVSNIDSYELVEILLRHGADPYIYKRIPDPFILALTRQHLDSLRGLLAHRPDSCPETHWTRGLQKRPFNDEHDMLEDICKAVGSSSINSYPILPATINKEHFDLAESLITKGISIHTKDQYGWNALHYAIFRAHVPLVRILLELGLSAHEPTDCFDRNHILPYPPMIPYGNRWTGQPLHIATMVGNVEIVSMLLDQGVDVDGETGYGKESPLHGPTALRIALATCHTWYRGCQNLGKERLTIARMLLEKGASIKGVGDHLKIGDLSHFKGFSDVWNKVRLGLTLDHDAEE